MAPPAGTLRVGRYFAALVGIFVVVYGLAMWPGQRHTPRLGIDLVGGTQVIFTAKAPHGKTPSSSAMSQAKSIMESRVNGSGVTEATVVIQGSDQLVVSIPGGNATDVQKLGAAAKLNFRGIVAPPVPVTCTSATAPSPSTSASNSSSAPAPSNSPSAPPSSTPPSTGSSAGSSASTHGLRHRLLAPSSTSSSPSKPASSTPSKSASSPAPTTSSSSAPAVRQKCLPNPLAGLLKADPTLAAALNSKKVYDTPLSATQLREVAAAMTNFDCAAGTDEVDLPSSYFIACDDGKAFGVPVVYLLGPVIVPGTEISSADAQAPNTANGQTEWTVSLNLKSAGDSSWGKYTGAHNINNGTGGAVTQCGSTATPCADYVAFTLDGTVITAPVNETAISGVATQISGNFTPSSAKTLAQELRYGALPLSFKAESAQHVSASLGTAQLKASFIAGGIGLVLVVLYSLVYYRALGTVTIASLAVSAGLTYACLVFLGRQIGFTLDLAGVAGFIVALGITADSFVVFFERLKDEVHEGRSVRVAVPRAWVRARRTILSADTVSFLAAAILYYFASADVKGFAFTLGLSTILDLVVVFLFTHPMLSVLSRLKAFGSARFTGLDALRGATDPGEAAPARRARAATSTASAPKPAPSAVAALEKDEPPADDEGEYEDDDETARERRRTTPQVGTAAERAAARRARLRGKTDGEEG